MRKYDPDLEPTEDFYRVRDKRTGPAGELVRKELLADGSSAALADARATYRVLYRSTSGLGDDNAEPTNEPIVVSGLIAFPRTDAPAGGWPVLSWAHGTVGSNDLSAPSMDPYVDADYGTTGKGLLRNINRAPHALLNAFLRAGWAVAMTDYEGLGTYGNHPYLLGASEGRGILDIVPTVRQLAEATVRQPVSGTYAIVGHSQGGQAALWAAHLATAGGYPTEGTLIGVAAMAPASNLTEGLSQAYASPVAFKHLPKVDLSGFLVLFCNGAFGGDPRIKPELIFQPDAKIQYDLDFNSKSRAELSEVAFWDERPPLGVPPLVDPSDGIFRLQSGWGVSAEQRDAWVKYWAQVDKFNPALEITVPIRISQARGDERVTAEKTETLIGQLENKNPGRRIERKFYEPEDKVPDPTPPKLGEHFGLLIYDREITAILDWFKTLSRPR